MKRFSLTSLLLAILFTSPYALANSEEELAAAVQAAINADPALKAQNLKVTAKKDEVTITGEVSDEMMMLTAAQIAEKVKGVKYVINEIYPKGYKK